MSGKSLCGSTWGQRSASVWNKVALPFHVYRRRGVVHGKMASAHFMCVTLMGNPYANKKLICFRFKKYQIFSYIVQAIVPSTILHKCLLYVWFITLWKTCILLSPHRFHLSLKSSLVSEFCSLSENDVLSCRFVSNYMNLSSWHWLVDFVKHLPSPGHPLLK